MSIAQTVTRFLDDQHARYDLLQHEHTESAAQSAIAAHVPISQMAKAVVLKDEDGNHLMALLPATNKLRVDQLREMLHRDYRLVSETELGSLFQDCEQGAVPAFGQAYGMDIVWDSHLLDAADVYTEAGDHEQLIHMDRDQFLNLMEDQLQEEIADSEA
jgi:Ala-tRNA(Pro) deacylase